MTEFYDFHSRTLDCVTGLRFVNFSQIVVVLANDKSLGTIHARILTETMDLIDEIDDLRHQAKERYLATPTVHLQQDKRFALMAAGSLFQGDLAIVFLCPKPTDQPTRFTIKIWPRKPKVGPRTEIQWLISFFLFCVFVLSFNNGKCLFCHCHLLDKDSYWPSHALPDVASSRLLRMMPHTKSATHENKSAKQSADW